MLSVTMGALIDVTAERFQPLPDRAKLMLVPGVCVVAALGHGVRVARFPEQPGRCPFPGRAHAAPASRRCSRTFADLSASRRKCALRACRGAASPVRPGVSLLSGSTASLELFVASPRGRVRCARSSRRCAPTIRSAPMRPYSASSAGVGRGIAGQTCRAYRPLSSAGGAACTSRGADEQLSGTTLPDDRRYARKLRRG